MESEEIFRIGLWMSKSKMTKFRVPILNDFLKPHNIQMTLVCSEDYVLLEDAKPESLDLLIYKLIDPKFNSQQRENAINGVMKLSREHPKLQLLNNLGSVLKLLNRIKTEDLCMEVCKLVNNKLRWMKTVLIDSNVTAENSDQFLTCNNLTFPIICKPVDAVGDHGMKLVFNKQQFDQVLREAPVGYFSLQSFINHGSCLIKIYVIGEHVFVVRRPSVKNFYPNFYPKNYINFSTADVSKVKSKSDLIGVREDAVIDDNLVIEFVSKFIEISGLMLFGIDVIVSSESGAYYIIDVNQFPGYEDLYSAYSLKFVHEKYLTLFNRFRRRELTFQFDAFSLHRIE
ncbi:inositol-tetrakisphosphate 1-kinase-like isoform X2 [Convolutriloba macropyga]